MCNSASKVFFWDLKRLEAFHDYIVACKNSDRDEYEPIQRPVWLPTVRAFKGTSHDRDVDSSPHPLNAETLDIPAAQMRKYDTGDLFGMVEAHKTVDLRLKGNWTGRQVAWSPCGKWCVVVGSPNVVAVFERWWERKGKGRREG
jgi:polycomb protein EED